MNEFDPRDRLLERLERKMDDLESQVSKTQGEMLLLQRIILSLAVATLGISNPLVQNLLTPKTLPSITSDSAPPVKGVGN